jgi:hypothetical protein
MRRALPDVRAENPLTFLEKPRHRAVRDVMRQKTELIGKIGERAARR